MAVTYDLLGGIIRFTTSGAVEHRGGLLVLKEGIEAAAQKTVGSSKWHIYFDIRLSTDDHSMDEVREVAEFIAARRSILSGLCAITVADSLHYGLARMFTVFMEGLGFEVRVFSKDADVAMWFADHASQST